MSVANLRLTSVEELAGHLLLYIGVSCLAAFGAMDFLFRIHLKRAGYRQAFLRGHFGYLEYLRVKDKHGWPAWPIWFMWAMLGLGIALMIVGSSRL